MSLIISA